LFRSSAAVMVTVSLETLPAGILPAMSAEFSQSGSGIGRLVSVWGFTVILTSLPLVRLFARWDRRTVTSLCLAITGLFSLGTALRSEDHTSELQSRFDLVC